MLLASPRRSLRRPRPGKPASCFVSLVVLAWLVTLCMPPLVATAGASAGLAYITGLDLSTEREVVLPMLSYVENDGDGAGYSLDLYRVVLSRNREPRVRVGFFEDVPSGAGSLLRSSGWMAALVATRVAGVPLDEVTIAYDIYDYIDGPSAGAIMTVAVLAGLLGHDVNLDTLITGAINPDGTIGPVGGIVEKLHAAAAGGHRTVLIPLGQRFERHNGGRPINLYALGLGLGVEVREVGDIYEAYAAITGHGLPRATAPRGTAAELPPWAKSAYRTAYRHVLQRVRETVQELAAQEHTAGDQITQYLHDGQRAAASGRPALAYAYMHWAEQLALEQLIQARLGLAQAVEAGDAGALSAAIHELRTELDETRDTIAALWTATANPEPDLAQVPFALEVYGLLWEAKAAAELAYEALSAAEALLEQPRWRRTRRRWDEGLDAASGYILDAVYWYALAETSVTRAADCLALAASVPGSGRRADAGTAARLARIEQAAAYAALEYFDWLWLEDIAVHDGLHLDVVREMFMVEDPDYAKAAMMALLVPPPDAGDPLAALAGAVRISHTAGLLVNYYYTLLDTESDEQEARLHPERLEHMLRVAEANGLAAVARARERGIEPIVSLAYLETADALRQRESEGQLMALSAYWLAEAIARVTADLAR